MSILKNPDPQVVASLQSLLKEAQPVYTGIGVACVLETSERRHTGFNSETKDDRYHAEWRAVDQTVQGRVDAIHIMSSRQGYGGLKHAIPCHDCASRRLLSIASPDCLLYLYDGTGQHCCRLPFHEIVAEYAYCPKHAGLSGSADTVVGELALLTDADRLILAGFLSKVVREYPETEIYITGSASGRGGPRALLNTRVLGQAYQDIDLVVIDAKQEVSHRVLASMYRDALKEHGFDPEQLEVTSETRKETVGGEFSLRDRWVEWSEFAYGLPRSFDRIRLRSNQFPCPPAFSESNSIPKGIAPLEISLGTSLGETMSEMYRRNDWYCRLEIAAD